MGKVVEIKFQFRVQKLLAFQYLEAIRVKNSNKVIIRFSGEKFLKIKFYLGTCLSFKMGD